MNSSDYVDVAEDMLAHQRYFEAQANYKKAGDLLLNLYLKERVAIKKLTYLNEMLRYRRLTQQMDRHIDFDRYKAKSYAKILEIVQVREDECIGECSNIFRKYCNEQVLEVVVYEADVCYPSHLCAMRYLLNTFQKLCPNLRYFKLKCLRNRHCPGLQAYHLYKFQQNLLADWGFHFDFDILLQSCFDQPKIVFNTGHIFYFDSGFKFFVYADDPNHERCKGFERRVDIWHTKIWPN